MPIILDANGQSIDADHRAGQQNTPYPGTWILRQAFLIMGIFMLICAAGFFFLKDSPRLFQARAQLVPNLQGSTANYLNPASHYADKQQIKSEIQLLKSQELLQKALTDESIKKLSGRAAVNFPSVREAMLQLHASFSVKQANNQPVLELSITHEDPRLAQELLSKIVSTYHLEKLETTSETANDGIGNHQANMIASLAHRHANPSNMNVSQEANKPANITVPPPIRLMHMGAPSIATSYAYEKNYKPRAMLLIMALGLCAAFLVAWVKDFFARPIELTASDTLSRPNILDNQQTVKASQALHQTLPSPGWVVTPAPAHQLYLWQEEAEIPAHIAFTFKRS